MQHRSRFSFLRLILVLAFFMCGLMAVSQGEHNIWYFGHRAGLDFNSGSPVAINNCATTFDAWEENFCQSDSLGNLLFYLDEYRVFDRNHNLMPNGNAPAGWARGSQASFAVRDQVNKKLFYLFTMDANYAAPHGLCLHKIDMNLNGGMGGIITGHYRLPVYGGSHAAMVITGVRHLNNKDTWIVVGDMNVSKHFLAYLIDQNGLDTIPVISDGVNKITGVNRAEILRISPDGKVLILGADSVAEYCHFNTATGQVTPMFSFNPGPTSFGDAQGGIEFSRDSKYVYLHKPDGNGLGTLYQFNATMSDSALFKQSEKVVGINQDYSYLIRGPDGKIYLSEEDKDSLSVINFPSLPAPACDFQRNAIWLQGHINHYTQDRVPFLQQ